MHEGYGSHSVCLSVYLSVAMLAASLMTQPLYTHEKGLVTLCVHNELSQALECGATNQITSFVIKTLFA